MFILKLLCLRIFISHNCEKYFQNIFRFSFDKKRERKMTGVTADLDICMKNIKAGAFSLDIGI